MPEVAEVKIITEQIRSSVLNQTLINVDIVGGRFVRLPPDGLESFRAKLPTTIKDVQCKGKFIWLDFGDYCLWNTLGMTGTWSIKQNKHAAIKFTTDKTVIYFEDARRFGTVKFVLKSELVGKLATLGPDVLSAPCSKAEFATILKRQKRTIAESLMDQKVISGVGNYIKAEVLYRSNLSPWRISSALNVEEVNILYDAIQTVVQAAYLARGNTIATYKDLNGEMGGFANQLQVYKKNKDPQGRNVIAETTYDKRTTYWCPEIQK